MALAWRIGADTPDYTAEDLSGEGARISGGRWNRVGTSMIYTSGSIALACLETLVHLSGPAGLPLNRYLVRVDIPPATWRKRERFDPGAHVGWEANPAGAVSLNWGTGWAQGQSQLVAVVPSVVVPEELNVLINPQHPDMASLTITKVRLWTYDRRLA